MPNDTRKFAQITFEKTDFEVLDRVLTLVPELRICALAVKRARERVSFPVQSNVDLQKLLSEDELAVEGHRITKAHIVRYMSKELFPIENERQLMERVYVALCRCNEDFSWAARAPQDPAKILDEYSRNLEIDWR